MKSVRSVSETGYAIIDEELEIGLRSLAVPINTEGSKVVVAMNVGVNANRVSKAQLRSRILPLLRKTAQRVSDRVQELR